MDNFERTVHQWLNQWSSILLKNSTLLDLSQIRTSFKFIIFIGFWFRFRSRFEYLCKRFDVFAFHKFWKEFELVGYFNFNYVFINFINHIIKSTFSSRSLFKFLSWSLKKWLASRLKKLTQAFYLLVVFILQIHLNQNQTLHVR